MSPRAALVPFLALFASLCLAVPRASADRLSDITERGELVCGLLGSEPGLAERLKDGALWRGFDVDACAALAAAILEDPKAFRMELLEPAQSSAALAEGKVDLLIRAQPRGLRQRVQAELLFTAQGLMTRKGTGPRNLAGLAGQAVCVPNGEPREILTSHLARSGHAVRVLGFPSLKQATLSFIGGACAAVSGRRIALALVRRELEQTPGAFVLLPELMDLAPSGPIVPPGEQRLAQAVRWIIFALLEAERLEVTRRNVMDLVAEDGALARLLGAGGHLSSLGLSEGWSRRAIAAAGNYREIYDRHLGALSPLRLERGPNALQDDGGLLLLPSMQ